jgi:endonuclease G
VPPHWRSVVFQGPIFDPAIDHYGGSVQIPSSFFKVIVWKGAAGLKRVGLIDDQLALLAEKRTALQKPSRPQPAVAHWRAAIDQIEKRTGLSFGDAVRGADTIRSSAQPRVGEEAAIAINSLDEIPR